MSRLIASKALALSVGILCILLAYNHNKSSTYQVSGNIYGTYWKLVSTEYIPDSLRQSIVDELNRIDFIASTYKTSSELSLLNQAPTNTKVKISTELYTLLSFAEKLTTASNGAYDITLGSSVINAGFGPEINTDVFEPLSTKRFVMTEDMYVEKFNQFLFDLSSIAKGFAVDQIYNLLISSDKNNFLFDIGGELILTGSNHGEPWVVGIQDPTSYSNQSIINLLSDSFLAVATSGEYRNFAVDERGNKTSHTLDPQTGQPIYNNILSVTVTSKISSMEADAWATAMNVMGADRGLELAEQENISVLYIINDNDTIKFLKSNNWQH